MIIRLILELCFVLSQGWQYQSKRQSGQQVNGIAKRTQIILNQLHDTNLEVHADESEHQHLEVLHEEVEVLQAVLILGLLDLNQSADLCSLKEEKERTNE